MRPCCTLSPPHAHGARSASRSRLRRTAPPWRPEWWVAFLLLVAKTGPALLAGDPFAEGVRPTPWLSPADERKAFHLPPGFEIQLVASEPEINKPLNLAFDSLGRLWVTTSIEYPFAVPTNSPGRDRIMIFEDFGPDGRARKSTQFAGGLNIPIGVYPFHSRNADGTATWKAVAWSIPNIWLFEDLDGDGRSDRREALYAGFDSSRDTHGNQASFRRGFDGWLYCTHGYNNDSHVAGRDGNTVHLNSGNTYRIRLDGTRIEHYTHGQVNPFGLAWDASGNLFSSDCHSEPLYQLLAGGFYPSFGKPHDGLGFAPRMMDRKRGSTAIDGVSIYTDNLWPAEYHGNIFFCDVMTSRVYRDRLTAHGSTLTSHAMADFVSTDDPWFRPVDTVLGPDGALYIADFYNRIIGHYEVPLSHPGRDRPSGRIWRVVYRGDEGRARTHSPAPLAAAAIRTALDELAHPNLTRRRLATDELTDRFGADAVPLLQAAVSHSANAFQHVHALWALHRLGALDTTALAEAARSRDSLVRTHVARVLAARPVLGPDERVLALTGLKDSDALVQRCAAEALALHPAPGNVRPLLDLVQHVPAADTHLLYVVRKALRDQLVPEAILQPLASAEFSPAEESILADLVLSVRTPAAAAFLLRRLPSTSTSGNGFQQTVDIIRHVARHASGDELSTIVTRVRNGVSKSPSAGLNPEIGRQFALFQALDDGFRQRSMALPADLRTWGADLVRAFFNGFPSGPGWIAAPYASETTLSPWTFEPVPCADGIRRTLLSSRPHGDELTGVLRSAPFEVPPRVTFWLGGHDGYPGTPPQRLNRIRLCASPSGQTLAEAPVPRDRTARRVVWDLTAFKGMRAYVEASDGNDSAEDAWMAFGGFEPSLEALRAPDVAPRSRSEWMTAAAEIAARVQAVDLVGSIAGLCLAESGRPWNELDPEVLGAFVRAWMALAPEAAVPRLAAVLVRGDGPVYYRERLSMALAARADPVAQGAVLAGMKTLPQRGQERLATTLASARFSAETLLAGMEGGMVSPKVLQRVGVYNRLKVSQPARWEERVARLRSLFPPADDERDRWIAEYRTASTEKPGRAAEGRQIFGRFCAGCHRIGTEGALVGPQLDSIGQRGMDRLCEDVLDPNRNVDPAFRTTLLTLKDGEVVSGLFRREEGDRVILADATGREIGVARADIAARRESESSLMPDNFAELIPKEEFAHLMAFLLSTAAGH